MKSNPMGKLICLDNFRPQEPDLPPNSCCGGLVRRYVVDPTVPPRSKPILRPGDLDLSITKEYYDKFKTLPSTLAKFASNHGTVREFYADLREAINKGEPIQDLSAYAEKYQKLSTQ